MTGAQQMFFAAAGYANKLSGASILGAGSGFGTCSLIVRADGTVDKEENSTVTQIGGAADWITPKPQASGDFDVRFTQDSGSALDTGAASLGTWQALSSDRAIGYTSAPRSGEFTVEIRSPGGKVVATGSYTLETT